jgi:hypothetical protein
VFTGKPDKTREERGVPVRLITNQSAPSLLSNEDEALEFLEPVLDEDHFGDQMSARA